MKATTTTADQERLVLFKEKIEWQGFNSEAAGWLASYHLEREKEAGVYLDDPDYQHWDEYASIRELAVAADALDHDNNIDDIRDESGRECYQVSSSLFLLNTES